MVLLLLLESCHGSQLMGIIAAVVEVLLLLRMLMLMVVLAAVVVQPGRVSGGAATLRPAGGCYAGGRH